MGEIISLRWMRRVGTCTLACTAVTDPWLPFFVLLQNNLTSQQRKDYVWKSTLLTVPLLSPVPCPAALPAPRAPLPRDAHAHLVSNRSSIPTHPFIRLCLRPSGKAKASIAIN